MFKRPRWAIPTSISSTPIKPAYLITASSAGTALSPPSSPNRFVPTYLRARNFSHCSACMTLARIDCLPSIVNVISAFLPSIRCWRKRRSFTSVDVHIFKANVAAVIVLQHLDDLADGRGLEAERARNVDRSVEVVRSEAVKFGCEVRRARCGARGAGDQGRRRDGRARDRYGSTSSRGYCRRRRGEFPPGRSRWKPCVLKPPDALSRSSFGLDRGRGSAHRAPPTASSAAPSSVQRRARSTWLDCRPCCYAVTSSSFSVLPSSDGLGLTTIPAASIAAILLSASPLPPETIAPA